MTWTVNFLRQRAGEQRADLTRALCNYFDLEMERRLEDSDYSTGSVASAGQKHFRSPVISRPQRRVAVCFDGAQWRPRYAIYDTTPITSIVKHIFLIGVDSCCLYGADDA